MATDFATGVELLKPPYEDEVLPFVRGYWVLLGFGGPDEHRRFDLPRGIQAFASYDGTIMFDFHKSEPAPMVIVPQSLYGHLDESALKAENAVGRAWKDVGLRERANIEYMTHFIFAHRLCLQAAYWKVRGTNLHASELETHTDMYRVFAFRHIREAPPPSYYESRQVVELSMQFIGSIIESGFSGLLQMFSLFARANKRFTDWSFTESLVLSWTICERVVNQLWDEVLEAVKRDPEKLNRMDPKRRDKLRSGRDYSASVKTEVLELLGKIDHSHYEMLVAARKSRNDWLHGMKPIDESVALKALEVAARSINLYSPDVNIGPSFGGVGGFGGGCKWTQLRELRPDIEIPPR